MHRKRASSGWPAASIRCYSVATGISIGRKAYKAVRPCTVSLTYRPSGAFLNACAGARNVLATRAEPRLHALEVRVLETRAVLQAVSNGAIDADVREPDQAELNCGLGIDDESDCCEGDGK